MAYLKINNVDYSTCVNELVVTTNANYSAQTNAAGNTVADYINSKRSISIGIIPLDADKAKALLEAVNGFNCSVSFLNPLTDTIEENVACIIPTNEVSYYTIQADKVKLKAFKLTFNEL